MFGLFKKKEKEVVKKKVNIGYKKIRYSTESGESITQTCYGIEIDGNIYPPEIKLRAGVLCTIYDDTINPSSALAGVFVRAVVVESGDYFVEVEE